MKTVSRTAVFASTPEIVFQYMDDLGITGMHMTQSSVMMMGSKLNLEFLTQQHIGLDTKYRWTGKMMGLKMDFTVKVTKWNKGKEKIWETIGTARMIIYSWYRMQLNLVEVASGTEAKLSISYEPPKGFLYRILSFLFAGWYCRWCLRHMLEDCKKLIVKQKQSQSALKK